MFISNEVKLIVEAINNLRQPVDTFKDYIYPVLSAILSSALALVVAYISLHYQERIANEKRKAEEINKWYFIGYEAFQCLLGIKNNYAGRLDSNPIGRAATIPPILSINHDDIKINDSHKLAFLVPNKSEVHWCPVNENIKPCKSIQKSNLRRFFPVIDLKSLGIFCHFIIAQIEMTNEYRKNCLCPAH
jgi:hypothetical protein